MRASDDTKTADMLGDRYDLAGEVPAKPTAQEKAAIRAARYREKNGVRAVTLNLPCAVADAFDAYMATRPEGTKKGDVIAKLLTSQLLRKR